MNTDYKLLLQTKRNDIVDCRYYGSVYLSSGGEITREFGLSADTLFYMRSLAKPLQTSILFDYNIIDDLGLTPADIAIMAGSHAGSFEHIKLLKNLCHKYKIKLSDLELEPQNPLDMRNFKGRKTKLHNNCSGKHLMMVLVSRYLNFPLPGYTNPNHPVQKLIYKKQCELSQETSQNLSFDGCSTPLWAISARGIIRAYYNLISDKKYSFLVKSILKYPDIFGGFDRLDSDIIKLSGGRLFSKVGAGGFIVICNLDNSEILLVKLAQNNNPIRKLIVLDILNKLKWLNVAPDEYEYNQKSMPVAKYYYEFQI